MEKHYDNVGIEASSSNTGIGGRRAARRARIRQFVAWCVILWVALTKPLKFMGKLYPYKMRELARAWDAKMLWTFVLSGGKRIFMDQNCVLKTPSSFKPLIKTRPEWQFTPEQIQSFYENGFIGPITLWTPQEMAAIRRKVDSVMERPSKVYPKAENQLRDRYIDAPEFWDIISTPQLTERLAQLLGPDMLVWRSQIFNKMPGDPEITWHQASTYMAEQRVKATLEPKDLSQLFQLTTWIAVDDAYFENGCMHFLKGTQRKMWSMRKGGSGFIGNPPELAKLIGGQGRFAKASGLTLEVPITQDMIAAMPLKSGQAVIFTERCIHGSPPNNSPNRRFGFVFRAIKTDVQVYRQETVHEVTYLKETYDLDKWGCALLRGEDKYHLNRMIEPPVYDKPELATVAAVK
jgi:non-haem Fe2+, alpha-ketoglutarate-dependent halogenase